MIGSRIVYEAKFQQTNDCTRHIYTNSNCHPFSLCTIKAQKEEIGLTPHLKSFTDHSMKGPYQCQKLEREREMRQQQRQDGQISDETNNLVSHYLTAPPIVSLSLSTLLVEAIISQPHLSYRLILLCPFVSRRFIINHGPAVRAWSFGLARHRRMKAAQMRNYRQEFLCLYWSKIVWEGN